MHTSRRDELVRFWHFCQWNKVLVHCCHWKSPVVKAKNPCSKHTGMFLSGLENDSFWNLSFGPFLYASSPGIAFWKMCISSGQWASSADRAMKYNCAANSSCVQFCQCILILVIKLKWSGRAAVKGFLPSSSWLQSPECILYEYPEHTLSSVFLSTSCFYMQDLRQRHNKSLFLKWGFKICV